MACDIRTFGVWQGSFFIPVLLIVSLFCGIYSQSTIPGNPNIVGDFEKNEGETVTLSCSSVGGNPLPSVQWYKNTQLVDAGSSANGNGDGVYSVGSTTVTYNNYTFTVSRSDNLVSYICRVQNSVQTNPLTRSWTISVYVPSEQPLITGPQPAITTALNAGSTYTYVCTARNGRPAPNILWKLGTSLSSSVEFHQGITENTTTNSDSTLSKSSSLSWVPITADNGKSLYCQTGQTQAGGSVLTKSSAVAIVVQQIPILQMESSSYTGQVGASVTLGCTVSAATPSVTEIFWRKLINGVYTRITIDNVRFFGSSTSNANLTITNLALSDATSYQCSAVNAAGTGYSGATTLSVTGTLPTVQVGSSTYSGVSGGSVTLVCSIISSNPTATSVFWEKDINGNPTDVRSFMSSRISGGTVSQPSLSITSLTGSDTGRYYCSAGNSVGNGSRSATELTVQNRPSITLPQSTYSISFGQDVLLRCIVTSDTTLTSVVWRKYTNSVPSDLVVTGSSHYSGGTTVTPSLTVRAVTFSDSGNYDCSATNAAGTSLSGQITLTVSGTVPNVNIPQSSYSVSYGGSVTLRCDVTANPFQNRIEWQRIANGVSTTINVTAEQRYSGSTINTPSLTITGAISSDGGVYVCSATNNAGKGVSGQTLLTVVGNRPSVSVSQTSYSIFVGSSVTMDCSVSGNPAINNVFWSVTRNGFTNTVSTTGGSRYSNGDINNPSLTLSNAQQSDTGVFTCKAQNAAGTTDSNPITLTVTGTVPTVTVTQSSYSVFTNNDITMTCSVSANPAATITWVFSPSSGGQTTISSSSTKYTFASSSTFSSLTVKTANSNDQGSYACTASNAVGTNQATATLSVTGNLPFVNMQSTYSVVTGSDIIMTCSVTASPAVNSITWQFQSASGGSFVSISSSSKYSISGSSGTSSSLTVRSSAGTDNGRYRCQATNQVGTRTATTTLSVSGSIPTVTLPTTSYQQTYGQNITFQCSISATPAVSSVTWQRYINGNYQNINTLSSTKYYGSSTTSYSLTVTNLVFTDAGEYRCTATNQVGTGVSPNRVNLQVLGGQPTPNIPLGSYSVLIGNNIQIPCSVSADPAVTSVEWTFRSSSGGTTTISQSTTKYTLASAMSAPNLTINSAALTDAGTYTCLASNIVGTGSDSATLTITGNAATVSVSPPSQSVLQTNTAVISCNIANANPAVLEVTWEKFSSGATTSITVTGRFNGSTPAVPDLTITNVQPSDAGTYYCSARNAIGTTRSSPGSILMISGSVPSNIQIAGASSRVVVLGGSLTLQCSGQGEPAPTFTWIFRSSSSEVTQVGTGNTLTISNAQRTNGGTYTCRGTNTLGTLDSPGVALDVQYSPVDARTDSQKSLSVSVGSTVTLVCEVDANPSASYQWYRSSSLVGSQKQYSFSVTSSTLLGLYTCRATNSQGSRNMEFILSQAAGSTGASTASSGLSTGEIAAIILALLLLILLIIIIIICCLTHGVCGAICGKKQDVKGRVEPVKEKEVYKETQKEVIIPRFHEESIKGKRQPSAVSRKDVDIRVQNGGYRKENDYEIVRYETVPPVATHLMTESPRPHRLPAISYTYEDVEKKRKKRRKKKKHHHRRHHDEGEEVVIETVRPASPVRIIQEPVEEVVVERVIRSRSASPTRIIRTETEEPTVVERVIRSSSPTRAYRQEIEEPVGYSPGQRRHGYYDDERIIETRRSSSRSPRRHRHEDDQEMIIERRSPSTKRRFEENYITEERYSSGDVIQDDGDLRAYNGVVYREAPSRHGSGRYAVHNSERRSRSSRRDRGSDDEVEVVYGKEYVVEH